LEALRLFRVAQLEASQLRGEAAPVALGSSLGFPELPVQTRGLGLTNPINLYHFVSYPTVAFVPGATLERNPS
jgi:hypothetical protein